MKFGATLETLRAIAFVLLMFLMFVAGLLILGCHASPAPPYRHKEYRIYTTTAELREFLKSRGNAEYRANVGLAPWKDTDNGSR